MTDLSHRRGSRWLVGAVASGLLVAGVVALALATRHAIQDFPDGVTVASRGTVKPRVLARDGTPLNVTLGNSWNDSDVVSLAAMPSLLLRAFIVSEDRHFYDHHGVDWPARGAALWQDLRAAAAVRGASTITEQVVRMLHPRPRTVWSRWVEGFEAARLEARCSKNEILAFYLNQVPYAERRRGVAQAAHLYFNRSLETLTPAETLALAVLVRSPAGMDLRHSPARAQAAIRNLGARLEADGALTAEDRRAMDTKPLVLAAPADTLDAGYFVARVLETVRERPGATPVQVRSTLDPHLQRRAQEILTSELTRLAKRDVRDGAIIVVDHARNEILAWVVGHNRGSADVDSGAARGFDSVRTPRQPGSTMKPLLYGLALEQGWTAATLIDDSDLSESVGSGVHTFHNYSRVHYGPIRLREALGNSLNIPAIRTLKYVGREQFLARLHELGVVSLAQHPDFYGDGLALGNGEVTLYEMAQAYTALARRGRLLPLTAIADADEVRSERPVYRPEVARLVGDILSDPDARTREFGNGLRFPVETAIKTGTSTDYHDAWAIAYDYRHTVAVWMGRLDGRPMNGVTGAVGPAMVLRSVFSELNRNQETRDLGPRGALVAARICRQDGLPARPGCASVEEWFVPGTVPASRPARLLPSNLTVRLVLPTPGLQVARDPRIPEELEALPMTVGVTAGLTSADWYVDGELAAHTTGPTYSWPLARGTHEVYSRVWLAGRASALTTEPVRFYVR
jgi:penicillin-binding protein 1C